MITEIHCEKFRITPIQLNPGLNVVVGDEAATNSIGKSTFLMILDLMLGGDSFFEHNTDVINELGDHRYYAKFCFKSSIFIFSRDTSSPTIVTKCDSKLNPTESFSINEYREFLLESYDIHQLGMSFRALISPFFRVWGKNNLDPSNPLESHKKAKDASAIKLALSLFNKYSSLASLEQSLAIQTEKKSILRKAQKAEFVPDIGVQAFKDNIKTVETIDAEIEEIRSQLKNYAANIQQLVSKEALELKSSKDRLLETKAAFTSRLNRITHSLNNNSYIKSKTFRLVTDFFPDINAEKLADVEAFHSSITKLLRKELKDSQKSLEANIDVLDEKIREIDEDLSSLLKNVDNPTIIIDRVQALTMKRSKMQLENNFRVEKAKLAESVGELKLQAENERKKQLNRVQLEINAELFRLSQEIYGPDSKSPYIEFTSSKYTFEIFEDTGTGRAFSNLALFDLALLRISKLPLIAHDSPVFKNIENDVVSDIIEKYSRETQQIFIAIDETKKFGVRTVDTIRKHLVLALDDSNVLYVKDWRKKGAV